MKKSLVTRSAVSTPVAGFPVATRAGHLLFLSGRTGLDYHTDLPLTGYAALGRKPPPALGLLAPDSWEETFVAQASRLYEDMETLLTEQGAAKTDLLFYSIYVREMRNFPVLARTRAAAFTGGVAPPSTASQVPGLLYPGAVVYFDPVAIVPDAAQGLAKKVLTSNHVVQGPLSNYELASRAGDYTFYAGVVGAHPESGIIIRGANELKDAAWPRPQGGLAQRLLLDPISAQTYTIYKLFGDMLAEHGSKLENLLRFNIYLREMQDIPETERIGTHFLPSGNIPAGTAIGVECLARRDFLIEVEGIAYAGGVLRAAPRNAQVASWARYSDAVRGGDLVFVSGLLGYDPVAARTISSALDLDANSMRLVQKAISGLSITSANQLAAAAQTQCILSQLRIVLASLDSSLQSLLKITVYLRDMADFPFVRGVLLASLGDDPPAISVMAVADLPLREARVQIEAVAV